MKKYLFGMAAVMALVSVLLFTMNVGLAGRHLKTAADSSQRLLEGVARYVAADSASFASMEAVIALTGVERITITDTFGLVEASSSVLFTPGDDFTGYLVDTLVFRKAVREQRTLTTALKKIDGLYFRSCYMPVNSRVVVVDADKNYFSAVSHIRTNLLLTSGLQFLLLLAAVSLVIFIAVRYLRTQEELKKREKLSFLGRAASELAHELKNPLAIIKSSADVLQKKHDPERMNPAFAFLSSEAMRMSRLIDGMLGFVRDRRLEMEWLSLADLFGDLKQEWKSGTIIIPEAPGGLKVLANRDAFRQIMGNLIRNAVECGKEDPRIEVVAQEKGGFFRIAVKDDGPGIPEKFRKNIFEPFVTGKKEGTGLGLAIAAGLCEKHSWKICALKVEEGAEFEILVPEKLWQKS